MRTLTKSFSTKKDVILLQIIETVEKKEGDYSPLYCSDLPFAEILSVILESAVAILKIPEHLIADDALRDIITMLGGRISIVLSPVLYEEFNQIRPEGILLFRLFAPNNESLSQRAHYNNFIQELFEGGLRRLFDQYPVASELLINVIEMWRASFEEFFQRLERDLNDVADKMFSISLNEMGKLAGVIGDQSDAHHHGRTVLTLTFEGSQRLVYKPKDLQMDIAFTKFIDLLNHHLKKDPLPTAKVLNRQGYGWCAFIDHHRFFSRDEIATFYRKAGKLLAVVYILRGEDCHYENLIVNEEGPVLIDTEMLLQPINQSLYTVHNYLTFNDHGHHCVLTTGLVPHWDIHPVLEKPYTVSAFANEKVKKSKTLWKNINSDEMTLEWEEVSGENGTHLVQHNEEIVKPSDFLDEILAGFQEVYSYIQSKRNGEGIFDGFKKVRFRYLHRETAAYTKVLQNSLAPEILKDWKKRSEILDILKRAFTISDERSESWPLLSAEIKSLELLDIPYFWGWSNSTELFIDPATALPSFFTCPGYDSVMQRVCALSKEDQQLQMTNIKGSFNKLKNDFLPCRRDQTIDLAQEIGDEIVGRAYRDEMGFVSWNALSHFHGVQKTQYTQIGIDLYQGRIGVCLFLAALDSVTGKKKFSSFIRQSLDPILAYWEEASDAMLLQFVGTHGIGACLGLGSLVYGLLNIAGFLEEKGPLDQAEKLALFISYPQIDADRSFDITSGTSGALLSLLALYKISGDPKYLEQSVECGEHLLRHQEEDGGWKIQGGKSYCGVSHGASGIAYSLVQLFRETEDGKYLDGAKKGFDFEARFFSEDEGNWLDLRTQNYSLGWCHGAPGCAMVRFACRDVLGSHKRDEEARLALATTKKYFPSFAADSLCCGRSGHVDLFLIAEEKFDQKEVIHSLSKRSTFHPGLFQGLSGLGYQLLRIINPTEVPSILLWETNRSIL